MDLIYLILSFFLRLSPAVRKLSSVTLDDRTRRPDTVELAFWLPLVGWVSVSVQHRPDAKWLIWRVREVSEFHFSPWLSSQQEQRWRVDSKRRGRNQSPPRAPDAFGDSGRMSD